MYLNVTKFLMFVGRYVIVAAHLIREQTKLNDIKELIKITF